jgi:AbrB family looped-hinge helix DNA binding protein
LVSKSTVGPKGQITIPKELREKYHMHEGEEVVLLPSEEGVLIKHPPSTLRGRWSGKIDMRGFEKDIKELHKQWKM